MPENEEKPKRVNRFIYSEDDVAHIFRLGDIGTVFDKKEENKVILLKKLLNGDKK
jgi:hypothetical protein